MKESEWREKFLEAVSACSEEGWDAAEYIRARKTHVGMKRARKSVGAFWLAINRSIYLNTAHYSYESTISNAGAWALLIHEVRHLQQGALVALSIYGELDAWQYQMRAMKKITGQALNPVLEEIISLPLNMDRANLRRARSLMTKHAGFMYGAYLYPLYPIHKEIRYWFTGKFE
jgi:hypothetical protein